MLHIVVGIGLALTSAARGGAQSAQKFSFQVAALSTSIITQKNASAAIGFGLEPQLRFNRVATSEAFGALSIGLGGQWTRHSSGPDTLTISGVFFEPRWVPAVSSTRVFPYLSARFALLRQTSNFGTASSGSAFGGGGGLAIRVHKSVNLDAGVALVRQQFNEALNTRGTSSALEWKPFMTYAAKFGASIGFPR
ncbi:MAG: hypothetical protein ABMA00_10265 [Gemmatimonas sp.]